MYVGYGNCSTIIHMIAKHPIGALGAGVLALAISLTSPVGPGSYLGSEDILATKEKQIIEQYQDYPEHPQITVLADAATKAFEEMRDVQLSDSAMSKALKLCKCKNVTREMLEEKDPTLMEQLKYLYFLELVRDYGLTQAQVLYKTQ